MINKIEIGDTVNVHMHAAGFTLGIKLMVLDMPQATGDCWKFMNLTTEAVIYTSEPCTIELVKKGR